MTERGDGVRTHRKLLSWMMRLTTPDPQDRAPPKGRASERKHRGSSLMPQDRLGNPSRTGRRVARLSPETAEASNLWLYPGREGWRPGSYSACGRRVHASVGLSRKTIRRCFAAKGRYPRQDSDLTCRGRSTLKPGASLTTIQPRIATRPLLRLAHTGSYKSDSCPRGKSSPPGGGRKVGGDPRVARVIARMR
jgi:hypothetical protein